MKKWAFVIGTMLLTQTALAKGVEVHNAFARPTVAGVQQGGAFMQLKNTDNQDNVLIGASVSKRVAGYTELHTHINENGVMKMREVKGGIPLPAGETVELKSGGYHIMFFDLKKPLSVGKSFPLTLKFKNGKTKTISVQVKPMNDTAPQHHHSHHHSH